MNIPIFNLLMQVKVDYIRAKGYVDYSYEHGKSCVHNWLNTLNNKHYNKLFSFLSMKQHGDLIIIKYAAYYKLFAMDIDDTESGFDYTEFWNLNDGMFRECRGITIDIKNDKIVTLPFAKFFNLDEMPETSKDNILEMLKTAKRVEFSNKIDGSLVIARYYNNKIVISSSGELYDDNYVVKSAKKFIDSNSNYQKMIKNYPDYTFMFESLAIDDQHIVKYDLEDMGLHLIGMRNIKTGKVLFYSEVLDIAKKYNTMTTTVYDSSFDEILNTRSEYTANEKEGYVMNIDGFLVKIKCLDYIDIHNIISSNFSLKSIIRAMADETLDDILAYAFEKDKPKIESMIAEVNEYCKIMEDAVQKIFDTAPTDRIEFFAWLKNQPKFLCRFLTDKYLGNSYSFLYRDRGNRSYLGSTEIEEHLKAIEKLNI